VEEGRVVVEGTPGPHVYNPFAVVHGGFAAAILDNACGYAAQSKMAPGQMCTTLELKVAYHKAMTRRRGRCGRKAGSSRSAAAPPSPKPDSPTLQANFMHLRHRA
jgi:uncharacterized protein (TIGR00369 family)